MSSATKAEALKLKDKLYTLEAALDETCMLPVFREMMASRAGEKQEVKSLSLEVMRRRNQRCVIRYRVHVHDREHGRDEIVRIVGKVFKAGRGEPVYQHMRELWDHGFAAAARDHISIPEPLAWAPALCMLFQEEVPGQPIKMLLKQAPNVAHFRLLARTLAKLHRCPIVPGKPFGVREHLTRCHPRHEFLAQACPDLAPDLARLIAQAYEIEAGLGAITLAPVHGDFHMGQVHIEGERVWLIDFDALSYGDPASDLGNMLVFLKGKIKREPAMPAVITAFLEEYFSAMDPAIAQRIPLYEALTHLRRACKALRLQDEGWQRRIQRMIARGLQCLQEMQNRSAPGMQRLYNPVQDETFEEAGLQEAE